MKHDTRIIFSLFLLGAFLLFESLLSCTDQSSSAKESSLPVERRQTTANDPCSFASLSTPGDENRQFALIVGVSTYAANTGIRDLRGAHADADRVGDLLTEPGGYDFPKDNVCLLLNSDATSQAFLTATGKLSKGLRADDLVVIYIASHGSQTPDVKGNASDEPDHMDETIIFHDGVELVDDRFNEIITDIHQKTDRITVILDSCNSGTAFRSLMPGTTRSEEPDENRPKLRGTRNISDQSEGFVSEVMSDVVYLVAADDGTPAIEKGTSGVFTNALLEALTQNQDRALTYNQLEPIVTKQVSRHSYQRPSFHGATHRFVFDNKDRKRVSALTVSTLIPSAEDLRLELSGPLIFGVEKGAELAIYDGNIEMKNINNPAFAKAKVVVESRDGFQTTARLVEKIADATESVKVGDYAVLVLPVSSTKPLTFLVQSSVNSGLTSEIRSVLSEYAGLVSVTRSEDADFKIFQSARQIHLVGPSGFIRNSYCTDGQPLCTYRSKNELAKVILETLGDHAFHYAFSNLRGEGGDSLIDDQSVRVVIKPSSSKRQEAICAGRQVGQAQGGIVTIPICPSTQAKDYQPFYYEVFASLDPDLADNTKLFVGGVVFWNDGSRQALTRPERHPMQPGDDPVKLEPGLKSGPPLHALDHVMIFATSEPVNWKDLTFYARGGELGSRGAMSPIDRMLDKVGKTRGGSHTTEESAYGIWSRTSVYTRVEPNRKFVEPEGAGAPLPREYTIPDFDIRPYLPDDRNSALHKVLTQAHKLTNAGGKDGHNYQQHGWNKDTDKENLAIGIDCSRAIWFAFTRSNLAYTLPGSVETKEYLPTASMVSKASPLSNNFERCDNQTLRIGDVLVYRDETRGDGHTVMVIDPVTRVAWGSHGWDGNANLPGFVKDRGVEYQLIKIKPDWEKWDRKTMKLKACWRYRGFTDETLTNTGLAITKCDAGLNCSG